MKWLAPLVIIFMCIQLSQTVGIYAIGLIMCGSCKIALYVVLLNAVDGETLLLPVHVSHVETL